MEGQEVFSRLVTVTLVESGIWDCELDCGHTVRLEQSTEPDYWMLRCHECEKSEQK